jgi:tRNA modification GTPase
VALPEDPEPGRFWLGRFGPDPAEEVVVTLKRHAPVPWVEIHSHGGREVVRLLQESLQAQGVRPCAWQEFERSVSDPLQATAATALAYARTVRTAAVLLDQHQGAFERAVREVIEALERNDREAACRLLDTLRRYAALGRHLTEPWRVVVAGAPNVGKSSLVNALAGFSRCVVSATPGTTRDVVTIVIAVEGWPVELADTAGQRDEAESLEAQGIALARTAARQADLCLWVLDASRPPAWPNFSTPALQLVVNKIDLPAAWDLGQASEAVRVSAQTGAGLEELCQAMARWLVPDPPPPGAAVPFTAELCDRLEEVQRILATGLFDEGLRGLETLL